MSEIMNMRKFLILRTSALILISTVLTTTVHAQVKSVPANTVTMITNCVDLQNVNLNLHGDYQLANDIDCLESRHWNNGAGFLPIGTNSSTGDGFQGTFDGNGHTISNLYISRGLSQQNIGLFSTLNSGASIFALNLRHSKIAGPYTTSQYPPGTVHTGILVGYMKGGQIDSSSTSGHVYGAGNVGGFVGGMTGNSSITRSYSTASARAARDNVGGFIGVQESGLISDCYAVGSVITLNWDGVKYHNVAGFAGAVLGGTIKRGYAVSSLSPDAKGFIGQLAPTASVSGAYFNQDTAMADSIVAQPTDSFAMAKSSTYVGWQFNSVWKIVPSCDTPLLAWQKNVCY